VTSAKESPFQTKSVMRIYDGLKKVTPVRVEIISNQSCVAYVNLFIFNTIGNLNYCIVYDNPVYTTSHDLILLLNKVKEVCKQNSCIFLEVRLSEDESIQKVAWEVSNFNYRPWYNAVLAIDSSWPKCISESKWRNIRTSIDLGYSFGACESLSEIQVVFDIFKKHYRKINKPLPEKKFFENIFHEANRKKPNPHSSSELFVTRHKNQIIAASVVFLSSNTAAQFYFASLTNNKYLHPGSFHQWSMIEWAASRNYKWVDLVGGGAPNINYGVREFKRRFGIKFEEVGRYDLVFKPVHYYFIKIFLKFMVNIKKLIRPHAIQF
jgi:serine/alanine adding enzyme